MSNLTKQRYLADRKVELNELFFDLIFVYAISKIAHTILHVHHGSVSIELFLKYLIMTLIFTTIWSYQTFFTNRFGTLALRDIGFTMFNMFVVIYLSNSLYPDFEKTFFPFVLSTGILFLSISLQYFIRNVSSEDIEDKNVCNVFSITTLTAGILSLIALCLPLSIHYYVYFLAIGISMIGPLAGYRHLSASPVNMPHLVERYGLLTIIMFGEVMIGLASIFSIHHFDPMTILQFTIVVLLFWTYWIKTEQFMNHHQMTRGFLLYHSHIIIFLALGMFNAAMVLSENPDINDWFKIVLMYGSLTLYFIGYFVNFPYFHDHHKNRQLIISIMMILIVGFIVAVVLRLVPHSLTIITTIVMIVIFLLVRQQKLQSNI
ncbi:low temperature requirement protein A [Macrococcus capreoli]